MEIIKIGIMGTGGMALSHICCLKKMDNVEITGICGRSKKNAEKLAKEFVITNYYDDFLEMLEHCDMDAVIIVTPNYTHAEYTAKALEHNKHVLCEKPASLNSQEMLKIADLEKNKDLVLMYGLQGRFIEKVQYVRKLIQEGELGKVYFAKLKYVRRCGNPGGWFATKDKSGGGPLIDLGIHAIDIVLYLLGSPKPKSVFASTYHMFGKRDNIKDYEWYKATCYDEGAFDTEDLTVALIKFDDGSTFQLETSFDSHIKPREEVFSLDIYGDKAGLSLEPQLEIYTEKEGRLIDVVPELEDMSFDWNKGLAFELEYFVECIRNKSRCAEQLKDVISGIKIVDAIYESAKKGVSVEIC